MVLLAGALVAGCNPGSSPSGSEMAVIRTSADLVARKTELQQLTEATLIKHAEGKPLNQQDMDNLEKAEPIARGIVAFDSSVYTAHLVLGQIQLALGKRDDALRNMLQCVMISPPPDKRSNDDRFIISETLNDIGNLYYGKDQFDEAEHAVRQALEIDPKNIKYLSNLVQILHQANRDPEARQVLAKIGEYYPTSETYKELSGLIKEQPAAGAKKNGSATSAASTR